MICLCWAAAIGAAATPPTISSVPASAITESSAVIGCQVNPNGLSTTLTLEYGLSMNLGSSLAIPLSPNNDALAHQVAVTLSGLSSSTTYYCRFVAVNGDGTSTTTVANFTTLVNSAPNLQVSATSIMFNQGILNQTIDHVLTVRNTGTVGVLENIALTIIGTDAGQFSIVETAPTTLAAGASASLTVRFAPTSTGSKSATIRITSNDPVHNPVTINLSGIAVTHYQVWKTQYGVTGNDVADADGDGLCNWLEYAFGTHPLQWQVSVAAESVGFVTALGGPCFELPDANHPLGAVVFARRKDRVLRNMTYTVWFSDALGQWYASTDEPTPLAANDQMEIVRLSFPALLPNNQAARFFRVEVAQ